MTKALGYVRVSTSEQADSGLSLSAQRERIEAYARLRGLDLVGVVEDAGVSAGKPLATRPGGAELLKRTRKGEAAAVIVAKLDRAFRDASDCLTTTRTWDRRGVAFHVLDLGGAALDTSGAMGRAFLSVAAAFAELERNLVSERTAAAMARLRAEGRYCGGVVPFGYRLAGDGVTVEADPAEQEAVEIICELEARGLSRREIARRLNGAGVKTKQGADWTAVQVGRVVRRGMEVAA